MRKFQFSTLIAALLVSGSMWATGDATQETGVAQIGDQYYSTIKLAIADVPDNTETTIVILKNVTQTEVFSIGAKKNVVLELNGKKVSMVSAATSISMIENLGQLTIQDNTDLDKMGSGTGELSFKSERPDGSGVPGAASNLILNRNKLYIKSGLLTNATLTGQACYSVDQMSGEMVMDGGWLTSGMSMAVRMGIAFSGATGQKITINGGKLKSLWVQDQYASDKGELVLKKAIVTHKILIGYGYPAPSQNFVFTMDSCEYTQIHYKKMNPTVGANSISVTRNVDGQLYMDNPIKFLSEGIFCFKGEFDLGWKWVEKGTREQDLANYAAQGIRIDTVGFHYTYENGWWYTGYLQPQAHLHEFYKYIQDGYGLVPVEGRDMTYEILPVTNVNPAPADSSLGHPWHVATTWQYDSQSTYVPTADDAVQIDHNVYVEAGQIANAASLQLSDNSTLTVQRGATLIIEDAGALFKDEGSQLIIEPTAVVTVGKNGVEAQVTKNIVIQANETEEGVFMIAPDVTINTQPKAKVELYTKCKQIAGAPQYEYIWQRFALPTADGAATIYTDNHEAISAELFPGESSYVDAVFGWNNNTQKWNMLQNWSEMKPYKGYQLTNNTALGGVTYYFEGNLAGNHNGEYQFETDGFHFFGNSYTASIFIKTFLDSIKADNNGVQQSLWIYDVDADNFKTVTRLMAGKVKYKNGQPISDVRSMQAFIMQTTNASAMSVVNYAAAIWGNPKYNSAMAVAQRVEELPYDMATIKINSRNGQEDVMHIFQSSDFSADFEDGADATKFIYENSINLYAATNAGKLADVATNDLNNTKLSFMSGKDTEYTIQFADLNGETFTLIDNVTGTRVSMIEGSEYTFVQNANTVQENRFSIEADHKIVTELENADTQVSIDKVIENGQLVIVKDGVRYNAVGTKVK